MLDNLRQAEAIAEAQGDHREIGLLCAHMAHYYRQTGDNEQALACGERALACAAEQEDFSLLVLAHQRLGVSYHAVGDYHRVIELLMWNVTALRGELMRERFGSGSLPASTIA